MSFGLKVLMDRWIRTISAIGAWQYFGLFNTPAAMLQDACRIRLEFHSGRHLTFTTGWERFETP